MNKIPEFNKVMISIPCVDGRVETRLVRAIIPQMSGRPLNFMNGIVPLEMARNMIAETFLSSDCTHLFMVDADTIPPNDVIDRLLDMDTDIATAITPILNKDGPTSNVFVTEDEEGETLSLKEVMEKVAPFPVTGVGLSCVLIRRKVFEKLERPHFTSLWFQNGKFIEGDIHFIGKAREAGFTIMANPKIVCGHSKTVII